MMQGNIKPMAQCYFVFFLSVNIYQLWIRPALSSILDILKCNNSPKLHKNHSSAFDL